MKKLLKSKTNPLLLCKSKEEKIEKKLISLLQVNYVANCQKK